MIKLQDGQISKILPEYISDWDSVKALSFALQQAVQRLMGYCRNISVFAVIDTLPEKVLDLLALELNTQYYDDLLEAEAKRRLVKNTLIWYMSAGTPKAVEELIASVFENGEIKEWYEYGDEPYYFKIVTDTLLQSDTYELFSIMLERIKNVRSHIRSIEIPRTIEQDVFWGMDSLRCYRPPAIIDGYMAERSMEDIKHITFIQREQSYSRVNMEDDNVI